MDSIFDELVVLSFEANSLANLFGLFIISDIVSISFLIRHEQEDFLLS